MKYVEVYTLTGDGEDQLMGRIGWDGSKLFAKPVDSTLLQTVLNSAVVVAGSVLTRDDGEEFLANLCRQFRGAYLRVSEMQE